MKEQKNIEAISACQPDYMGFIFYEKSPRYIGYLESIKIVVKNLEVKTIGVFVNCRLLDVLDIAKRYNFDLVQLHGDESIDYLAELTSAKINCIKAFQISEDFDWKKLEDYAQYVTYFLFDTPTEKYGGSGRKFNWSLLEDYNLEVPFFLSGGISISDIEHIKNQNTPQLYGIDINSKFEINPGLKNVELVQNAINIVRNGK